MGWLKRGKLEGPAEIEKTPVIYGTIYEYDLKRLQQGDKVTWVVDIEVEQGGTTSEHKLRLQVDVK
jgi:hypothetical protein